MPPGLFNKKPCPISVSVKITERDKHKMVEDYKSAYTALSPDNNNLNFEAVMPAKRETPLPPLKYSLNDTDGWTDIEAPLLFLSAGKAPYPSRFVLSNRFYIIACLYSAFRDLMQWPLALPADGEIDLVLHEMASDFVFNRGVFLTTISDITDITYSDNHDDVWC